jgi:2EXR family
MPSFFALPLEIRTEIYTSLLPPPQTYETTPPGTHANLSEASLHTITIPTTLRSLTFCHEAHRIATCNFYRTAIFTSYSALGTLYFLQCIGSVNRAQVRRLEFGINELGDAVTAMEILSLVGKEKKLEGLVVRIRGGPTGREEDCVFMRLFEALGEHEYLEVLKVEFSVSFQADDAKLRGLDILEKSKNGHWDCTW